MGKSKDEVIGNLGTPDYDDRLDGGTPVREALVYESGITICRIELDDGKVVSVERYGRH
jgi:hypothetical protein